MLTLLHQDETEAVIIRGKDEVRIVVYPNPINKLSLYLSGATRNGNEIQGIGPMAMRANTSLWEYANLVGQGLEKGYRVFITKEGGFSKKGNWFIEFRLTVT